jgi:hypothetical protein
VHTYDLGEGVFVKVETQTGLCNVTAFKKTLAFDLGKKSDFSRWKNKKETKRLFAEFDKKYQGCKVRVFTREEIKMLDVKAYVLSGAAPNQLLWLHKELMPFYVNWVGAGDKVLKFTSEVFDTKVAFLRDNSASLELIFRELLERLPFDKEGVYIGPTFSNKLSKLIFGFNKDGENQWDQASAEQLMARILILTQYTKMLRTKSYTTWDEIRVDMNNCGKKLWFYWDGSTGKRRLKGGLMDIISNH